MIPVFGNTKCSAIATYDKQPFLKGLRQSFLQKTFNNFKKNLFLFIKMVKRN